jgi:hypothetical protein
MGELGGHGSVLQLQGRASLHAPDALNNSGNGSPSCQSGVLEQGDHLFRQRGDSCPATLTTVDRRHGTPSFLLALAERLESAFDHLEPLT